MAITQTQDNYFRSKWVQNANLNDYRTTGFYYVYTGCSNAPESYGWMLVMAEASREYTCQMFIKSGAIWVRAYTGNPLAWTSWTKFTGTVVS